MQCQAVCVPDLYRRNACFSHMVVELALIIGGLALKPHLNEAARKMPFHLEYFHAGILVTIGFDNLESALKNAKENTLGMYRLNGILFDLEMKIFENGTHIETIKGGFTESEYNAIKERQAKERVEREKDTEIKGVVSFSWKK